MNAERLYIASVAFLAVSLATAQELSPKKPATEDWREQYYALGDRDKLKFSSDGSLDIYIQNESPGADKEANWLPAPTGEFNLVLRSYLPGRTFKSSAGHHPP